MHVHSPKTCKDACIIQHTHTLLHRRCGGDSTCDQVHRYEHRTEGSQFREDVVDLIVGVRHLDRDLGEVVRVGAGEDFFIVVQVLGHRDQVILSCHRMSG